MPEPETLSLSEYPSTHWKKFFDRANEIETIEIDKWNTTHIIHYFCKRYLEHYGVKFSFRFNGSPSKSYEVFQINKLGQQLSTDPEILKDYIDWFFENKIIIKKKRITSLAFLTEVNIVNEFKFKKLAMDKNQTIDRTTSLPEKLIKSIRDWDEGYSFVECKTYGDLAFLFRMGDMDGNIKNVFSALQKEDGFDLSILNKVK